MVSSFTNGNFHCARIENMSYAMALERYMACESTTIFAFERLKARSYHIGRRVLDIDTRFDQ